MRFVLDARYAGRRVSGIGNYVRALATRLPRLAPDCEFRYWIPRDAEPLSDARNVRHHRLRPIPNSLATLLATPWLDTLGADDVLHAPANVLGLGVKNRALVTVHDLMWLEHLAWCQPNPWLRPISKRYFTLGIEHALRTARRILTVSKASADAIARRVPDRAARIVVTPNGCEPHFRPPENRDRDRAAAAALLGFQQPFFLIVGQNVPSKGHEIALAAFALANVAEHRLVFVQRLSPGKGLHRRASELGVVDRVHFISERGLDELLSLLHAATALVQPSLAEGFGLPALEAAAAGAAVLASDIAPLVEILGDAAEFHQAGSAPSLARSLEKIAGDPGRLAELRARGPERARPFDWDETARITWQAYRDVAAQG
jgi:glycosyltransferase involved in cell wall biosynthesis